MWRIIAYTMLLVVVFLVAYFAYLIVFPNAPRAEPGSPWADVIGVYLSAVATFPAWRAVLRKKFRGFEIRLLLSPIKQATAALPVSWGNVLRTYGSFWIRAFIPVAIVRSLKISPWDEILLPLVAWAVLHWMLSDPLGHENAPGKLVLTLVDTSEPLDQ
jgi:hypothetical protein